MATYTMRLRGGYKITVPWKIRDDLMGDVLMRYPVVARGRDGHHRYLTLRPPGPQTSARGVSGCSRDGELNIPLDMTRYAGLRDNVTFVVSGPSLEEPSVQIWDTRRWKQYHAAGMNEFRQAVEAS